jgi:hypothetical protein
LHFRWHILEFGSIGGLGVRARKKQCAAIDPTRSDPKALDVVIFLAPLA